MNKGLKHLDFSLVTDDQSPEIAQVSDGSLDFPASFIPSKLAPVLSFGFAAVFPMRADQVNSSLCQSVPKRIGICCFIVDQPCWIFPRPTSPFARYGDLLQRRFNQRHLMRRCRGKEHSHRNTLAVCHHHKLCTLSAFRLSDAIAPFFAGENVPSANTSDQSMRPSSSSSPRNFRQTFNHTPSSSHCLSRRQQVLPDGKHFGRSFQRAPLRSTQMMPSNTGRFGIGVRPPFGETFGVGNNGPIFAHCLSVNSECSRAIENSPFGDPLKRKSLFQQHLKTS